MEILPSQHDHLALQESGAETICRVHSMPLSLLLMQPWLSVEWHIHHSLQRKLIGNVLMISLQGWVFLPFGHCGIAISTM